MLRQAVRSSTKQAARFSAARSLRQTAPRRYNSNASVGVDNGGKQKGKSDAPLLLASVTVTVLGTIAIVRSYSGSKDSHGAAAAAHEKQPANVEKDASEKTEANNETEETEDKKEGEAVSSTSAMEKEQAQAEPSVPTPKAKEEMTVQESLKHTAPGASVRTEGQGSHDEHPHLQENRPKDSSQEDPIQSQVAEERKSGSDKRSGDTKGDQAKHSDEAQKQEDRGVKEGEQGEKEEKEGREDKSE